MIITSKKSQESILEYLNGKKRVFLFGCNSCAEQCETGGEREVRGMEEALKKEGKEIIGSSLLDETCYNMRVKREFKKNKSILESDAILVLACGAGIRTVALNAGDAMPVYPALDTIFLATVDRYGRFFEGCALCGECVLGETAGICPHTYCPKDMLNGPCGGMGAGRCEVDKEKSCAWVDIYTRLKAQGRLQVLRSIKPPKDHSINSLRPRKVILERKGRGNSCPV